MPQASKKMNQISVGTKSLASFHSFASLKHYYLDFLKQMEQASEHTLRAYEKDIERFAQFVLLESDCNDLEIPDFVQAFLFVDQTLIRQYFMDRFEQGRQASTLNRELASVRSFYQHFVELGLLEKNPTRSFLSFKKDFKIPDYLSIEELDKIRDMLTRQEDALEMALFQVFYSTGMRISEVANLQRSQIFLDGTELCCKSSILVLGKGKKQRWVFFTEKAQEALLSYEKWRRAEKIAESSDDLWVSEKNKLLTTRVIYTIVNRWGMLAGVQKRLYPHMLRHTFATDILNAGANMRNVQEFLGHSSISSTQIYTHTSLEKLQAVHREYHPRSKKDKGKYGK